MAAEQDDVLLIFPKMAVTQTFLVSKKQICCLRRLTLSPLQNEKSVVKDKNKQRSLRKLQCLLKRKLPSSNSQSNMHFLHAI